jgi:hypothetical protein
MKLFLVLSFIICSITAHATDYYISSSGNDANNGTSSSTPWRTLNKLNASFGSINAGDRVYLNRGDVFYGSINVTKSGTSGAPITIGAYGSGAKPIVTGFTTVTSWTNIGGNIWESQDAVSSLPYTNMVAVNSVNTPMGRWPNSTGPNTGYLTIKSNYGSNSLTGSGLGGTDWTGADVVIRKEKWALERGKITGQSGSTLYYKDASGWGTKDGYGFFIQNDARTLDLNGEWYYNPSTKKIRIVSNSYPGDIKVATIENLVSMDRVSYITFDNIAFSGSNSNALYCVNYGTNLVVQNCDISFVGGSAVYSVMNTTTVKYNNINNINYAGIRTFEPNAVIQYNNITNTNMFEGMEDQASAINWQSSGITTSGENSIISNNQIVRCGYSGIKFDGRNTTVKNNFIDGFCYIKEDGGGIDMSGRERAQGSTIDGNIVLNGIGAKAGCLDSTQNDLGGIFIDAYGTGISIINNTVANCSTIGIKIHGANNIIIKNNTTYNNGGSSWAKGGLEFLSNASYPIRNIQVNDNIFFAKTREQLAFFAYPPAQTTDDIKYFGSADNNYYAKPIDPNSAIKVYFSTFNAAGWASYSNQDWSSKGAPKTISNEDELRFEYNATSSSKTIQLDANYIDVKNVSYNGSITLAPFTSAVLIRNGAATRNQTPSAYAGSDETITLPQNSISLNGSGSDADGNISSYNWSKLSGPSSGNISDSKSAATTINSLEQGTYQLVLQVTDNGGASASDTVQITVRAAVANTAVPSAPTVNAGNNQTINLPATSASLNGSASAEGASISSYSWSKISGPSANIVSSNSASTQVTGLAEGVYVFQLKVMDSRGTSNTANVQITVNSESGLLPAVYPENTLNGIEYKYYEGSNYNALPDFTTLTPVKAGTTPNFDLSVANRSEVFAISFNGYIDVPTDGQYTFYTNSDDGSRLYIDNHLVVDNDGVHSMIERSGTIGLKAGKHVISVGFFQKQVDKELKVSYEGPGISKQIIPSSALYSSVLLLPAVNPANIVNGLNYKYYEADYYETLPAFNTLTPVKTGTASNFDISLANRSTSYSFNFTGYINVPKDGVYTFYTTSDDGSKLFIDNVPVVDNDGLHSAVERSGTIGLKAGMHAISLGFFQERGENILSLSYAGPGITKQVIPSSALYMGSDSYLLPNLYPLNTVNGLDYKYYEAERYSSLPSFNSFTPVKMGSTPTFDISLAKRSSAYSFNFSGYINVPSDGQYTFYTTSDDGSNLYIDNVLVVDNDGLHSALEKSGTIGLKAGKHLISVGFFEQDGQHTLSVNYAGPGFGKKEIPTSDLYRVSTTSFGQRLMSNKFDNSAKDTLNARFNQLSSIHKDGASNTTAGINVFPNPFNDVINININEIKESNFKLVLMDASGKVLWVKNVKDASNSYHEVIYTSSYAHGIYFLNYISNDKNTVIKLIK